VLREISKLSDDVNDSEWKRVVVNRVNQLELFNSIDAPVLSICRLPVLVRLAATVHR